MLSAVTVFTRSVCICVATRIHPNTSNRSTCEPKGRTELPWFYLAPHDTAQFLFYYQVSRLALSINEKIWASSLQNDVNILRRVGTIVKSMRNYKTRGGVNCYLNPKGH